MMSLNSMAFEQHRPAADQHDIAEMKVAVDAAYEPLPSALAQKRPDALICGAALLRERVDSRRRKDIGVLPERLDMLVDIGAERFDPRLRVDRLVLAWAAAMARPSMSASASSTPPGRRSRVLVSSKRSISSAHSTGWPAPPIASVPPASRVIAPRRGRFRRVGLIDRNLGLAGGPALFKRRIVEEGESDGALDLEHPVGGQKHRRRMSIDTRYRVPAMSSGIGEKVEHLLLAAVFAVHPLYPLPAFPLLTLLRSHRKTGP